MIILGTIFSDIEFGMTISWDTDNSELDNGRPIRGLV